MASIIDVSHACGVHAAFLAGSGVRTIIRYYSRDTGMPAKRLTRHEAEQFAVAGIDLAIVHEARHGNRIEAFTAALGTADAKHVIDYGRNTIRQPAGSTVYYGVDFDASEHEITSRILPYFQSIADVMAQAGASSYAVGVYGSGRTCRMVSQAGLARHTWLAQATGWAEYAPFRNSNAWSLKQAMPIKIGEVECDPNVNNPDLPDFGAFSIGASPHGAASDLPGAQEMTVAAGPGLRLRAGSGTDFDVIGLVPKGAKVKVLKIVNDWALVDIDADGAADGFLNLHFLTH